MGCDISQEQLWSWIDRDAPELDQHLADCPTCRAQAQKLRRKIKAASIGSTLAVPLPERIGPFAIKRLLGEGGQALVYEAEQPSPRRAVALKVLKGGRFVSEKRLKHFQREMQSLASLQHPGIATIFEAGRTEEGLHYFAMELVDGVPLHTFMQQQNPSVRKRLELFRKVCQAVHYAHEKGVIHLDLKPSNILVTADGEPKILDFGLARMIGGDVALTVTVTQATLVEGTPQYMSPEQAHGERRELDPRSDVYALGVMLYELLTGRPPYRITSLTPATLQLICQSTPSKPSRFDRSLRGDLETIVLKALAKEPERRYDSAASLAEDLRRFQAVEPILARPPNRLYLLGKWLSRHQRLVGITALALLLAVFWVRQSSRLPYNLAGARRHVMILRCELFEEGLIAPLLSARTAHAAALQAPRSYPELPEAVLTSAQAICMSRGQYAAANRLTFLLEEHPEQWPYRVMLAEIYAQADNPESTEFRDWQHHVSWEDSAATWYLMSFATLDIQTALARASNALAIDPLHPLYLQYVARLRALAGDEPAALELIAQLVELSPDDLTVLKLQFDLLIKTHRYEEALAVGDRLLTIAPNNYGYAMYRAQLHRTLKNYESAVADFTHSIEIQNANNLRVAWQHYHRATPLWILGRREEAAADYRKCYQITTFVTFGNARLYLILEEQGKTDEASAALADARAQVEPDSWLAQVLDFLAGEMSSAQLHSTAAAADPVQQCEACYYIGEICLRQGQLTEAGEWFQRCLDTKATNDPNYFRDPLSEYELAEWRLKQLADDENNSTH